MAKCKIIGLKKSMIKGGMNPKVADKLAKKHCSYLNRVYKDSTISQKAKIAMTLGLQ